MVDIGSHEILYQLQVYSRLCNSFFYLLCTFLCASMYQSDPPTCLKAYMSLQKYTNRYSQSYYTSMWNLQRQSKRSVSGLKDPYQILAFNIQIGRHLDITYIHFVLIFILKTSLWSLDNDLLIQPYRSFNLSVWPRRNVKICECKEWPNRKAVAIKEMGYWSVWHH